MGDYPDAIIDFGTTDSYSTQIGELAHRLAKKFYAKTNKRNFERQIASQERRQRLLRAIKKRVDEHADKTAAAPPSDATITPPQALHKLPDPAPRTPSPLTTKFFLEHHHANTTTFPSPNEHGSHFGDGRRISE
ncbi:hypothetical protein B0H17DRAFT_1139434 [Mycena rosella]|uniref:Uncharacterized protein n=1 Tax=Mycena rosella TaxID=1033263 RepID=A0AAD7D5K7_MYCRO|nr:hypothetical protein B0H17DRAFT_1139434 [Mycena rosella]